MGEMVLQRATKVHTRMLSEWKWKAFDDFQQGVMISDLKLFILLHCVVVFLLLRVSVEPFLERSNSRTYRRDITISTRTGEFVRGSIRWFVLLFHKSFRRLFCLLKQNT